MKAKPDLHDVVELREEHGGYPAGAVGAVVELLPKEALVEFADEHGRTVELLSVVPGSERQVSPAGRTPRRWVAANRSESRSYSPG